MTGAAPAASRPLGAPAAGALSISDLTVRYGGVTAVSGVSLDVEPGEFVGLIGPNGAGKTTMIDAITGFARAAGRITLDGRPIEDLPSHRRARLGLLRTWQTADLSDQLTVRENLAVACGLPSVWSGLRELVSGRRNIPAAADEALELLGLAGLADALPDELSQGQRKLVDVARAVAARPSVLCLDEPAAGLDTAESAAVGERLRAINASGVTVLLVDHDMGLVMGVCTRIAVLDFGQVIACGPTAQVRSDPAVLAAYLGDESAVTRKKHEVQQ
jgi:branched-chain amino acid transport system ATP-binding protein